MTDAELEEKLRAKLLPENQAPDDSSPGDTVEAVIRLLSSLDRLKNGGLRLAFSLGQTISATFSAWLPDDRKKKSFTRWHLIHKIVLKDLSLNYARWYCTFYELATKYPKVLRLAMSIHEFRPQHKSIEYALECNKIFWSKE